MKIDKIFFCTGARNHELLKVFESQDIKFEYDERMASFKALGLSKISKGPVAVCTTSGTAVAQCVPAMLEAYYSELPFILITGDRPKKLHGTGAPQTIEHEALTRSCRRSYIEIDVSELSQLSIDHTPFPIHINVLVDDTIPHELATEIHQHIDSFDSFLKKFKKPLFLFSHENKSMRPLIEKFSKFNLTFYAEALSGGHDLSLIKTEKKLVKLFESNFFDCIIRIGHTPLTKVWRLLEKNPIPVFNLDSRNLPALSYGEVLSMDSVALMQSEIFWNSINRLSPYPVGDETIWSLEELINKYPESEISFFKKIHDNFSVNDHVYLGNSLVIRFFELTQTKKLVVYGNRGVNGIDGQLSSAIGVAMGSQSDIFCILGDVTTFYDLSSLRDLPKNLFLIIINNKGGRIFDMLNLDKRIILEHDEDFKHLTRAMGHSYSNNLNDFGKVQVLELFPDRAQSDHMLREWSR